MIDAERQRELDISSDIFAQRLEWFVKQFAPEHPQDKYDFQMALIRLMTEAMQHKSRVLSAGLDHYASELMTNRAMAPLNVIMKER